MTKIILRVTGATSALSLLFVTVGLLLSFPSDASASYFYKEGPTPLPGACPFFCIYLQNCCPPDDAP